MHTGWNQSRVRWTMNKGQTSFEYVSTYIWAGIAVAVAVAALTYFGAFDSDKYSPEKCYSGEQMFCDEAQAYDDGTLAVRFRNDMPKPVTVIEFGKTDPRHARHGIIGIMPGEIRMITLTTTEIYALGEKKSIDYYVILVPYGSNRTYNITGSMNAKIVESNLLPIMPPVCGNGVKDPGEDCDLSPHPCRTAMTPDWVCRDDCTCGVGSAWMQPIDDPG